MVKYFTWMLSLLDVAKDQGSFFYFSIFFFCCFYFLKMKWGISGEENKRECMSTLYFYTVSFTRTAKT